MNTLPVPTITDIWVAASWEDYLQTIADPAYQTAKGYYHNGQMRLESPVGPNHATDNGIVAVLLSLYGIAKGISLRSLITCSYRKAALRECQPDISYYIGDRVSLAPTGNSVVNLNHTPPPDLAIEIAATTLADDLGSKRLLYEDLGVAEYWVVDVNQAKITAFEILGTQGSQRLAESKVLLGLSLDLLEQALQRSRQRDNTEVGTWFLAAVQPTD